MLELSIFDLPTEILLNIFEQVYIIDDLLSLYKSCILFKKIIDKHRCKILVKLFNSTSFSNSYYNLFFSFVNCRYEYIKDIPYKRLNQLLKWKSRDDGITQISTKIQNEVSMYFIDLEKYSMCFADDCLHIFKNFMYLLYMPSEYIFNSVYLLNKFFNISGLCNSYKNGHITLIKIQKELNYYNVMNRRKPIYKFKIDDTEDTEDDSTIFQALIKIYPDVIIDHILNFQKLLKPKQYKKLLHNFVINLFLEWLFEAECEFIETIYYKLYNHFPVFMQRTIYRVIYNEFDVLHHITSDEFVEQFYSIHRIFLPSSKISRLYNRLNLEDYRRIQEHNQRDWKRNLNSYLQLTFS